MYDITRHLNCAVLSALNDMEGKFNHIQKVEKLLEEMNAKLIAADKIIDLRDAEIERLSKDNKALDEMHECIRFLLHMESGEHDIGSKIKALTTTIKERATESNDPLIDEILEVVRNKYATGITKETLKKAIIDIINMRREWYETSEEYRLRYSRLIDWLERRSALKILPKEILKAHRDNEKSLKKSKKVTK